MERASWLRKAEGELRAAAVDLGADPPLVDDALPEGATVAVLATDGEPSPENRRRMDRNNLVTVRSARSPSAVRC